MSHVNTLPSNELSFLTRMFAKDVKNYHVWSYRQWLVRHFDLWVNELSFVDSLLQADVRNNSAWNHRWFVTFGKQLDPEKHSVKKADAEGAVSPDTVNSEIEYVKSKIALAPQNQSPWNYLRGLLKQNGHELIEAREVAEKYAPLDAENDVRSSHALDLLADILAQTHEEERSGRALALLANRYDPIRKNYWNYKRSLLGLAQV